MLNKTYWLSALMISMFLLLSAGCSQQSATKPDASDRPDEGRAPTRAAGKPTKYEVAAEEDASHKATTKPIASYSPEKLAALPDVKRIMFKLIVPTDTQTNQVEPTVKAFVAKVTGADPDIDELDVRIYARRDMLDSKPDVGSAVWGPDGRLGKVAPEVAKVNNRKGYGLKVKVREHLEEYLDEVERVNKYFDDENSEELTEEEKQLLEDVERYKKEQSEKQKK